MKKYCGFPHRIGETCANGLWSNDYGMHDIEGNPPPSPPLSSTTPPTFFPEKVQIDRDFFRPSPFTVAFMFIILSWLERMASTEPRPPPKKKGASSRKACEVCPDGWSSLGGSHECETLMANSRRWLVIYLVVGASTLAAICIAYYTWQKKGALLSAASERSRVVDLEKNKIWSKTPPTTAVGAVVQWVYFAAARFVTHTAVVAYMGHNKGFEPCR